LSIQSARCFLVGTVYSLEKLLTKGRVGEGVERRRGNCDAGRSMIWGKGVSFRVGGKRRQGVYPTHRGRTVGGKRWETDRSQNIVRVYVRPAPQKIVNTGAPKSNTKKGVDTGLGRTPVLDKNARENDQKGSDGESLERGERGGKKTKIMEKKSLKRKGLESTSCTISGAQGR